MVIKSVGALSLGKTLGVIYGSFGLLFGAIFSLAALFGIVAGTMTQGAEPVIFGLLFGVGAIVILPLFYGAIGFLGGLLVATIYNLASRWTGGLEIETG